ncbi:hypothetical protein KEM55_000283, partial [Ascosphaera atra]
GLPGDEMEDYGYSFVKARRHSNSGNHDIQGFKSKFEVVEPEPVFEEAIHGPLADKDEAMSKVSTTSESEPELKEH